jgi:hypothetical protein
MQPAIYESDIQYLRTATTKAEKIAAIDAIIEALYDQMLVLAQQDEPVTEFMLNDGQTIIKGVYKSTDNVMASISALTLRRNTLAMEGRRSVQMVDKANFNGRRY